MKKAWPQIKLNDFRKGRAFPHIGRHSRNLQKPTLARDINLDHK